MHFVIRLDTSCHPTLIGKDGKKVALSIAPGEKVFSTVAYTVGLLVGEELSDLLYGPGQVYGERVAQKQRRPD
ncbi:MAG: hypothetical protein QN121_06060 [Armatimonadota bacterium]|nr:hypothetical protein [Armatimonadota bacterium]